MEVSGYTDVNDYAANDDDDAADCVAASDAILPPVLLSHTSMP